jgi:hypothetical protein
MMEKTGEDITKCPVCKKGTLVIQNHLYYLHIIWYPISSNAGKPSAQFNDVLSIIPLII